MIDALNDLIHPIPICKFSDFLGASLQVLFSYIPDAGTHFPQVLDKNSQLKVQKKIKTTLSTKKWVKHWLQNTKILFPVQVLSKWPMKNWCNLYITWILVYHYHKCLDNLYIYTWHPTPALTIYKWLDNLYI